MFLPEELKIAFGIVILVIFGLGWASRRYPDVGWLRAFDLRRNLSDEQRARFRRRANLAAGMELILLGIAIPIGFLILKVMLLSRPTTMELGIAVAASVLCIVLGVVALVRDR